MSGAARAQDPRRGLRVGGHVDRYVGSLFVSSWLTAALLVVGLFLIIDMASNLVEYLEPWPDGRRAPSVVLVRFYVLNLPFLFLQVAPFVTLAAGMFTVARLLKHNEALAVLSAGVSSQRMLLTVFLGALLAAAGMFALREWATSAVGNRRDALRYVLEHKTWDHVHEALWLRDLSGNVVRLDEFRPRTRPESGEGPPLAEVVGLEAIAREGERVVSERASRAVWVRRGERTGWALEEGVHQTEQGDEQVRRPVDMLEVLRFTPDLALTYARARENPLELSFGEVSELASRDPDNVVYQTLFHYHLTFPLANVVLLLVGLPMMMRQLTRGGAEGMALGCLLCVFYFAADFVFRSLGMQGALDPRAATWIPVLFFGSLGLVMFDSMRS